MNQNGQPPLPETYTLPAPLVSTIYQILSQVPAGNAARAFVQLENQIARQNQAHQAQVEPVEVEPETASVVGSSENST